MKKLVLILLIFSTCLFSGCAKQYKTVSEYSAAMNEVKSKLGDYTIDAVVSDNGKIINIKSYTKGDAWRADISENGGNSYDSALYSIGRNVYILDKRNKTAIEMPIQGMLKSDKSRNSEFDKNLIKVINPVNITLHWDLIVSLFADKDESYTDEFWKFDKISEKNNYKCRMILGTNNNEDQICVNDQYGVAVYLKVYNPKERKTVEINVKNIDNTEISQNDINLPANIKKISMADLFQNMANTARGIRY